MDFTQCVFRAENITVAKKITISPLKAKYLTRRKGFSLSSGSLGSIVNNLNNFNGSLGAVSEY
jgi:hypothetical protein